MMPIIGIDQKAGVELYNLRMYSSGKNPEMAGGSIENVGWQSNTARRDLLNLLG